MIEESKDELQKMLDEPGNSHAVSPRNDFIAGLIDIDIDIEDLFYVEYTYNK